ncbi:protein misato [Planococcus citri]|uniref:protein misato n=1 Tax=Planococcus citri TaxID=170843 RepID=UPI0031F9736D
MSTNELITLQFGHYSNFIGSHWWNIQEASFIYNADVAPEINYDVLFREGENLKKEVTFTPRLLLVDVKGSLGCFPERSDLYEDPVVPEISEDVVLWSENDTEVKEEPKRKKNQFLEDLERQEEEISEPGSVENAIKMYHLDDDVTVWSDYLGTRFHPRTINLINEYQHGNQEQLFDTYAQGTELWKSELFSDEWADKCRIYAEECNYLQGFQVLFDCVDGFSGLTISAIEYLQDEYSSKSIFGIPNIASFYENSTVNQSLIRTINGALSFAELSDFSVPFVPLSTATEFWYEPASPRKFNNINYKHNLWYHSSALLASYLDSMSLIYRKRTNPIRLSSFLSRLVPSGRKLLNGTMRLPFPVYPETSILECFEKLSDPIWTPVTPHVNVTVDSSDLHDITIRGLNKFRLLPDLEKRNCSNPAYKCQNVDEMLISYFEYCSDPGIRKSAVINSFELPLKVPVSFPNIFDEYVTRTGYVSTDTFPMSFSVIEAPMLTGLHNTSNSASLLTDLHEKAAKIKLKQIHQFSAAGLEQLEYNESLEKLLTLRDNYED